MPKPIEIRAKVGKDIINLESTFTEYIIKVNSQIVHRGRYQNVALSEFNRLLTLKARS